MDAAHRGLLDDIVANPDDDTPRLVMADWLDENGQEERARFIRLQLERAQLSRHSRRAWECRAEEELLLAGHEGKWLGRLGSLITSGEWRRGFVERASVGVARMARNAADLFSMTPLYHLQILRLSQTKLTAGDLAKLVPLQRTRSLCLRGTGLSDEGIAGLLRAVGFPALESLDLSHSARGEATLAALEALALPRLRSLADFIPGFVREPESHFRRLDGYRLEEIELGAYSWTEAGQAALAGWPGLAHVRRLRMERAERIPGSGWLSFFASPYLGPLEALRLAGAFRLRARGVAALAACPRLSGLRTLDLELCSVGDEGMAALTRSGMTGIEELRLGTNGLTGRGVRALACWPGLSAVRTLSLCENNIGNEGLETLLSSPYIGGLVSLDLRSTGLTSKAALLLENCERMPSLAHLDLSSSGLGRPGLARVRGSWAMNRVIVWGRG